MKNYIFIAVSIISFSLMQGARLDPKEIPNRPPTREEEEQIFFQHLPETIEHLKTQCEKEDYRECSSGYSKLYQDLYRYQKSLYKLPGMSIALINDSICIQQTHPEPQQAAEFSSTRFKDITCPEGEWQNTGIKIQQKGIIVWPDKALRPIDTFFRETVFQEIDATNEVCKRIVDHKDRRLAENECRTSAVALAQKASVLAFYTQERPYINRTPVSVELINASTKPTTTIFKVENSPTSFSWHNHGPRSQVTVKLYENQRHINGSFFFSSGRNGLHSEIHSYSYTKNIPAMPQLTPLDKAFIWAQANPEKAIVGGIATILSCFALKRAFKQSKTSGSIYHMGGR